MLSLLHARTFLAIIDENGVRPAARRLNLSPSTIIEHLRQLEMELEVPLLLRRRGAFAPTTHGLAFLPLARALVSTAEKARAIVTGAPLRLAASTNIGTYMLQAPLATFQSAGATSVDLWIGPNPLVAERLETGTADLALMEWWDRRLGFDAIEWKREPLVLIVPPMHRWAHRSFISPEDLCEEPLLGGEPGTGTGTLLREKLGFLADRLRTIGGFGSTEAVKRAVRAGLGVSLVLAASVADELAAGQLVALPIRGVTLSKTAYIVLPSSLPATAPAARFCSHMVGGA